MKAMLLVIFISLFMLTGFSPVSTAIKLDGKTDDLEWKNAQTYDLNNGGKLMIKKEGKEIWVAMTASKKSWAHVYLSYGDTIRILHASAALGEARYVKQNQYWKPVKDFTYQLRDRIYNDTIAEKQETYYRNNGWAANNNNMNDGMCIEYRIDLSNIRSPLAMAFLILDNPDQPHYFPVTLTDHTLKPRLMQGYTPDSLQFVPSTWKTKN